MYHLELRQFPHNLCRFNLTGEDLRATVLEAWVRERWIELGERKWNPQQATLTVLEGPRIPLGQLTMGRGWRAAQRAGRDVTEDLLGALKRELEGGAPAAEAAAGAAGAGARAASPDRRTESPDLRRRGSAGLGWSTGLGVREAGPPEADLVADSLGLELLAQIGTRQVPLRSAWELAGARHGGGAASESLAIAERAVRSLLRSGLVVLLGVDAPAGADAQAGVDVPAGDPQTLDVEALARDPQRLLETDAERLLAAIESWTEAGAKARVWLRRA